ncbi:hypothetical protein H5410_003974 [Solanum commersonii]|uniref:Uncharacterized protein n=1 Tax=Solanum commersonii TaxID=4109 RepID=A0A9J6B6F7_SOLCO|nr:hypothetical protein H5410_003974 [Solanum commersonii]
MVHVFLAITYWLYESISFIAAGRVYEMGGGHHSSMQKAMSTSYFLNTAAQLGSKLNGELITGRYFGNK